MCNNSFVDTVEIQAGTKTQTNNSERIVIDKRTKFWLEITLAVPEYLQRNKTDI